MTYTVVHFGKLAVNNERNGVTPAICFGDGVSLVETHDIADTPVLSAPAPDYGPPFTIVALTSEIPLWVAVGVDPVVVPGAPGAALVCLGSFAPAFAIRPGHRLSMVAATLTDVEE